MSEPSPSFLKPQEEQTLLRIARFTLEKWVEEKKYPSEKELKAYDITPALEHKAGVFVSLHKMGELRGCIGYVEDTTTILRGVIENTVNAASKDPRFPPVNENETDMVDIEVSVMTPLEPVDDIETIEVGKDGLVVERGFHRGLLLPQVATEWGWDKYEFLENTCQKAGLPPDAYQKKDTKIFRFRAQVFGEKRI
ncbi:MAG: AmmeMemoRadiSam system protein A [Candidatus Sumerlaeota bacterium]|nr:AmmeMemoRadiSam system protein A [Candidatus Sumerlaeota bacterium]